MKSFQSLFSVLTTVAILAVWGASALASETTQLEQSIACKGKDITVFGVPQSNQLLLTLQGSTVSRALSIIRVIPMLPVYSVAARKDNRPVDGNLSEANLTIQTGNILVEKAFPSQLIFRETGARNNLVTIKTFRLTCKIK